MPRTGSNYLSYLLHDHPNVMSLGEAYYPPSVTVNPGNQYMNKRRSLFYFRKLFPTQFLKYFIFRDYPPHIKAVGFRVFYHYKKEGDHFQHFPSIKKYLVEHKEVKIIHLIRNNLLENYVSLFLALKRDYWWTVGTNPYKYEKIKLQYKDCLRHFSMLTSMTNEYRQLFKSHSTIEVYYEDLVQHKKRELDRIQEFLGIRQENLSCALQKLNTRPMEQVISNFEALKKRFAGSRWIHFFDESQE